MSEFESFGKIPQFRDVVYNVRKECDYHSELPTIRFYGSVKIHGTNSAVGYDETSKELYVQTRKNKLALDGDHYGFPQWVKENEAAWLEFFSTSDETIIFGEWAGQGIQKDVGISKLEKQFYAFPRLGMNPKNCPFPGVQLDYMFEVDIDFDDPKPAIDKMMKLTEDVEACCPIAGEGIGEGIVWRTLDEKYRFKVKGEKHSVSKVKTLRAVPVHVQELKNFLDYAVTENRVKQGIFEVKAERLEDLRKVIAWVTNDVLVEEADVIEKGDVELKHIQKGLGGAIAKLAKRLLLNPDWETTKPTETNPE